MPEIFTLTIKCIDGAYWEEGFSWVVEVPSDMTLEALYRHILKTVFFYGDRNAAFFIAKDIFTRKRVWLAEKEEGPVWYKPLNEIYPLAKGHRLYFIFDSRAKWLFSIAKRTKVKTSDPEVDYPLVIRERGRIPEQHADFGDG